MFRKWLHAAAITAGVFTGATAWADVAATARDARHTGPAAEKPANMADAKAAPASHTTK